MYVAQTEDTRMYAVKVFNIGEEREAHREWHLLKRLLPFPEYYVQAHGWMTIGRQFGLVTEYIHMQEWSFMPTTLPELHRYIIGLLWVFWQCPNCVVIITLFAGSLASPPLFRYHSW